MIHCMKLQPAPFLAIAAGQKTIEMRLYDQKRAAIRIGDQIEFTQAQSGERLTVTVTGLYRYPDFEELYRHHDASSLGYAPDEPAHPADMAQYYPACEIAAHGVLAIEIART